jgi:hypothetical protein
MHPSKLHHVQYQKKKKVTQKKDKVSKVQKEKTVEKIKCGAVKCICKPNIWQTIFNFIKKIFKR